MNGYIFCCKSPQNQDRGYESFQGNSHPQSIPNNERVSLHQLAKNHLLMSWDKTTNFAEVMKMEFSTHCWRSHSLRFCKRPFPPSNIKETTCLIGVFFNIPTMVQKLCAQKSGPPPAPANPLFYGFIYLLTSAKEDFLI